MCLNSDFGLLEMYFIQFILKERIELLTQLSRIREFYIGGVNYGRCKDKKHRKFFRTKILASKSESNSNSFNHRGTRGLKS
ncbi:hypothetical protein ES703_107438 [subsurface metagenome]